MYAAYSIMHSWFARGFLRRGWTKDNQNSVIVDLITQCVIFHCMIIIFITKDCHQWCEKGGFGMTGRPRDATK